MRETEIPDFVPYTKVFDIEEALPTLVGFYLGHNYRISELVDGKEVSVFVREGVVGVVVDGLCWPVGDYLEETLWFQESRTAEGLVAFEEHCKKPFVVQGYLSDTEDGKVFAVRNILDLNHRVQLTGPELSWFVGTYNENPQIEHKLVLVPQTVYQTPFAPAARKIALESGSGNEAEVMQQVANDVLEDLQKVAIGASTMCPTRQRKGLVFTSLDAEFVFKVEAKEG